MSQSFQLQLSLKIKVLPYFFFVFLYVALRSFQSLFTTISLFSHISNFEPSDQTIFLNQTSRLDHKIRPAEQPIKSTSDQTTTPDNRRSVRSDHRSDHAPPPTPDHRQTRPPKSAHRIRPPPPNQTSRSDQPNQQPNILDCSTSNQHNTPREMEQVRCIVCRLGQGGYIELQMNFAKHTFHTRSA